MEENRLIIIPGDCFTKRELSLRLDAMGVPKPKSQDKQVFVSVYNEAMKLDVNKGLIISQLIFDTNNTNLSQQDLNQCLFWIPTQLGRSLITGTNANNKNSITVQSSMTKINSIHTQSKETNLSNRNANNHLISRPSDYHDQRNLKEIPTNTNKNLFIHNDEIKSNENRKHVIKPQLMNQGSKTIENEYKGQSNPPNNKYNYPLYQSKTLEYNQPTSLISNQNIRDNNNTNTIQMNTGQMPNNGLNYNNKHQNQFAYNQRQIDNEEIIDNNRFYQGIKNTSFQSKTSFNDNNPNIQDEIIGNSSFCNNSLIEDNAFQQENYIRDKNRNVNSSQGSFNQSPVPQRNIHRTNSNKFLKGNAKRTNIKSTTPSLSLFTIFSGIIILLISFSPLTDNIQENFYLIIPLFFLVILLAAIIYKLMLFINQKNIVNEIYQNLRGKIRDNENGLPESDIIRKYSLQYNMTPSQFEMEVLPLLNELRKRDDHIKLRESFINDELVILWQWED